MIGISDNFQNLLMLKLAPFRRSFFKNHIEEETPPTIDRISSPKIPKISEISSTIFKGSSVFLNIQNKTDAQQAKIALEYEGAVVLLESPLFADILVSDTNILPIQPNYGRTRGLLQLQAAKTTKKHQVVVLLSQIPWIYSPKYTEKKIKNEMERSDRMMVVADSSGRCRPNYQYITKDNILYFGEVPFGYNISPFDPLPDNFDVILQKIEARRNVKVRPMQDPSNNGYCEICSKSYERAEDHHKSKEHQTRIQRGLWTEFDKVAKNISLDFYTKLVCNF